MTIREKNETKETSGVIVGAIVAFAIATFVAGVLTSGMFLGSPVETVDAKAEYCRGYGDGSFARMTIISNAVVGIEANITAAGYEAVFGTVDPVSGQVIDSIRPSEFLPAPSADHQATNEDSCNAAALEVLIEAGLRGPISVTTTTVAP